MACSITIDSVEGVGDPGQPAANITVSGTATACELVVVEVTCGEEPVPYEVPVEDGEWEVTFDRVVDCTCDEDIEVVAWCAGNEECSDDFDEPLDCGEVECPDVVITAESMSECEDGEREASLVVNVTSSGSYTFDFEVDGTGDVIGSGVTGSGNQAFSFSDTGENESKTYRVDFDSPPDCDSITSMPLFYPPCDEPGDDPGNGGGSDCPEVHWEVDSFCHEGEGSVTVTAEITWDSSFDGELILDNSVLDNGAANQTGPDTWELELEDTGTYDNGESLTFEVSFEGLNCSGSTGTTVDCPDPEEPCPNVSGPAIEVHECRTPEDSQRSVSVTASVSGNGETFHAELIDEDGNVLDTASGGPGQTRGLSHSATYPVGESKEFSVVVTEPASEDCAGGSASIDIPRCGGPPPEECPIWNPRCWNVDLCLLLGILLMGAIVTYIVGVAYGLPAGIGGAVLASLIAGYWALCGPCRLRNIIIAGVIVGIIIVILLILFGSPSNPLAAIIAALILLGSALAAHYACESGDRDSERREATRQELLRGLDRI